jgi:protein-disulfide isomerase/uncharacterized membrane protein
MPPRTRLLLFAFCLLGLGASLSAAYVHYRLLSDPTYSSFCDVNTTVNCTAVYESRFGTVGGIPVAVGGVIWFALALLMVAMAAPAVAAPSSPPSRKGSAVAPVAVASGSSVPSYLFILSTAALAVVLYLGYASFFILKAVCILCLLTYVAVIGVFLVSGQRSSDVPMRSVPGRALADARALIGRPVALVIAILFLAGAASVVAWFPRDFTRTAAAASTAPAPVASASQVSEFERWYTSLPRMPIIVPSDGAQVVVVKFADYQCPACSNVYFSYKSVFAKYEAEHPGAVKLVMKDYPLEPECNPGVGRVVHEAACEAAAAVRMARLQKRDAELEEWFYSNQATMTPETVKKAAKDIGHVDNFDAQYAKVLESVRRDAEFGQQMGVGSTPTFFINGVKVANALQPQFFDAALAYELKRASAK